MQRLEIKDAEIIVLTIQDEIFRSAGHDMITDCMARFNLREPIAKALHALILLIKGKIGEGFHE